MKLKTNNRILHLLALILAHFFSAPARRSKSPSASWYGKVTRIRLLFTHSRKSITAKSLPPIWVQAMTLWQNCAVAALPTTTSFLLPAMLRARSRTPVWLNHSTWPNSINYSQLSPKLRALPLVKAGGQIFGVPFMWGPNPLLYDTTAFPQAPDSWSMFWDPNTKERSLSGMTFLLSTWLRNSWVTTSQIPRNSTT